MSKYPGRIVSNLAPAGYSVFFDGTGDQLTIPSSSAFAVGTVFTFECWIYPLTSGGVNGQPLFVNGTSAEIQIGYQSATAWGLAANGIVWRLTTTTMPTLNAWNHVVVVRSGLSTNQTSLFLNGVRVANGTVADTFTSSGTGNIGLFGSGTFTGYISNLRLVKGTAVYDPTATTINVPTQLLNVTNTQLLTCNSPAIIDQSTNNFTITANGNAAVSTLTPFTAYVPYNPALGASTPGIWTLDEALQAAGTRQWNMYDPNFPNTTLLLHGNPTNAPTWLTDVSTNNYTITPVADARAAGLTPFSTTSFPTSGSGYFDGTGDYLQFTSNTNVQFGSGDFTVEAWVYLPSLANTFYAIAGQRTGDSVATVGWSMYINASKASFDIANGTSSFTATNNTTLAVNTWYHIAAVRSGSNLTVYVNGTAGTPVTVSGSVVVTGSLVYIGFLAGSAITPFNGYISNIRIVKGVVVYTGNFTTPTAPLTAVQAAGTNISAITGTQTSLLTLQNSQSANNNAFLDSSSNNFLITRNGNTTQGSFSPFSQTGWSYFGSATTDKLTASSTLPANFGSGAFTIEAWVWFNDTGTIRAIASNYQSGAVGWSIFRINNLIQFNGSGDGGDIVGTTTIAANTWYHVAVSGTPTSPGIRLFINGVQEGSTYTGAVSLDSTNAVVIGDGAGAAGSYGLNGFLSNFRILKGTALYTTNFTPPTSPLTAIPNTSLLTCQSNRFVDNSGNGYTFTVNNTPSVQAFSPFYPTAAYTPQTIGGSGFFDGATDYLQTPSSATLQLGSSDFSIEWWEYRDTIGADDTPVTTGDYTVAFNVALLGYGGTSGFISTNGSSWNVFSGAALARPFAARSWNHYLYTRSGTAFRVFINGLLSNYATASGSVTQNNNRINVGGNAGGATYDFPGYISNVRVVKGSIPTAYQTSSTTTNTQIFTPPTSPVTTTSQGATANDVILLLNFTNAGVVDSTAKNVLETIGNAQISTAVSRFGGSSISMSSGGYLVGPKTDLTSFATGDFTMECWVYFNVNNAFQGVIATGNQSTGQATIRLTNAGKLQVFINAGALAITGGTTVSTGVWHHVAATRSGTVLRLFLNGVQEGSTTSSDSITGTGGVFVGNDTGNFLNGFVDEVRITKGFARYTAAFTPQTSQWQDQ